MGGHFFRLIFFALCLISCTTEGVYIETHALDSLVNKAANRDEVIRNFGQPTPKTILESREASLNHSNKIQSDREFDEMLINEMAEFESNRENDFNTWALDQENLKEDPSVPFRDDDFEGAIEKMTCMSPSQSICYVSQTLDWLGSVEEKHIIIYFDAKAQACGYRVRTYSQIL